MGIVLRQSLKATIILYIGILLGYINVAYFYPKVLSPDQMGLLFFLYSTASLLVPFTQLGMSNITIRFRPYFKEEERHKRFLTFINLIPVIGFLVLFGLLLLLKDEIINRFYSDSPLVQEYYYLIAPLTLFLSFFSLWAAYSRSLLRIVVPNIIDKLAARLFILVILLLFLCRVIEFPELLWLYVAVYFAGIIILLIYIHHLRPVRFSFKKHLIPGNMVKNVFTFGGLSILTSLGTEVVTNIDTVMVSAMAGLAETGIYSIAFFIGAVIEIPMRSVGQISAPILADAWKNNNLKKVAEIYDKSSLNLIVFGSILFIGVWINVDNIFELIPNGELFEAGKYVILFIAMSKLFSMAFGVNSQIIANSNYYYVNLIALVVLAGVTVITNIIFIPMYSITGAALATTISLVLYNLVKFVFIWAKFGLQPFRAKTVVAISIAIVTFLVGLYLPAIEEYILDIFYRSAIVSILFFLFIYFFKVSDDLNAFIDHNLGLKK